MRTTLGLLVLAFTVLGCAPPPRPPESSTTTVTSATYDPTFETQRAVEPRAPAKEALVSDAQILGIVAEANAWEVDLTTVAKRRGSRAEVKEVAGLMFKQHSDAQMRARSLGERTRISPVASETSQQLHAAVATTAQSMRDASGDVFDRFFVDAMITYHRDLLVLLDQQLIPSATNGELKLYLVDMRQRAVMHLARLEDVQMTLGRMWGARAVD